MENLNTKILTERKDYEEPQEKDGHLQSKERGLEHIFPSQPSEETNSANTLSLDLTCNLQNYGQYISVV